MLNFTRINKQSLLRKSFFLGLMLTGIAIQAATLNVSTSALDIGYNQRSVTFNITSDTSWTISGSISWIYTYTYSGFGDKTVTFYSDANTTTAERTATITVSGGGLPDKTVTITQSGVTADKYETNDTEETAFNGTLAFNNDVAIINFDRASLHSSDDMDYYKISLPEGYSYNISSKLSDSNNDWSKYSVDGKYSYKIDNGSWSSTADSKLSDFLCPDGGSIYFKVVSYYSPGELGAYSLKIIITRGLGTPSLTLSSQNLSLDPTSGSSTTFTVTSNTNWSIGYNADWLSVSPRSGSNNGTVTITADANVNTDPRGTQLTVSANGLTPKTITITQASMDLPADSYEPNETEPNAFELPVVFTDHMAIVTTTAAQISTSSDVDYYKINVPAGFIYNITALFHDSHENYNLFNGEISYKLGSSGSWSSTFDYYVPDFTFAGGDYIYFKVQPHFTAEKGKYTLDVTLNQNSATPTMSVSTYDLTIAEDDNSTNTFTVTSNSGWRIVSSDPWITVSPASGWGNNTVTVTGMANTYSYSRYSYLTVSCPGVSSQYINVSQDGGGSPLADGYETNDTEVDATDLAVSFTDDLATIRTIGSNIHSSTDVDYYKVQLPAGYTYSVTSRLLDSYNYDEDEFYTIDAKYAVKKGAADSWNTAYDYQNDFIYEGGDYLYFKVLPYYSSYEGTYSLEINIYRALGSPTLNISSYDETIEAASGSSVDFSITSSGTNWTISSSESWLTPNITTGTGNTTITLNATANGNELEESGFITVSGYGVLSQEIYVSQNGIGYSPDIYEDNNTESAAFEGSVAFSNDMTNFSTYGANLNSTTDTDYYKINLPSGYIYSITPMLYDRYSSYDYTVDGLISYKSGDSDSWSNTFNSNVPQFSSFGGNNVFFKVAPRFSSEIGTYDIDISITRTAVWLDLSESAVYFEASADTATINITSNLDWTVTSSETWLTVDTLSGSDTSAIKLFATENPDDHMRTATISVTGPGITRTITVFQATTAASVLEVSATDLNVAEFANSTVTFDITSNIVWTVSSSETWLSVSDTLGINNATITLTANSNTTASERIAKVIVSGSGIADTITVTQSGLILGLGNITADGIKLYPNPVIDILTIELSGQFLNNQVRIYSETGELKSIENLNKSNFEIDLSRYNPGIYFISIISPEGIRTVKILKR